MQGRPRQDERDQLAIDLAEAFRVAWQLGAQRARDLAIAVLEGTEVAPSKRPRGRRPADWKLTGFENLAAQFENRSDYLRWKAKGALPPRPVVVNALAAALQSGNETELLRVLHQTAAKK